MQAKILIGALIAFLVLVLVYPTKSNYQKPDLEPFPVTVNPRTETIVEDENIEAYLERENLQLKASAILSGVDILSGLASAIIHQEKLVRIRPGMRKEEVSQVFSEALSWSGDETKQFSLSEGSYLPGLYNVKSGMTPLFVQKMIRDRFEDEVLARYSQASKVVPLNTALIIASLIQREAGDEEDMRVVSGIIWNRIFKEMPLQLDATLQYAKANEKAWWPQVSPNDKFRKSPYNTYDNKGLPPTPIANPSMAAIVAALNPVNTDCLFYFHHEDSGFHCSPTYQGHVALLKKYYGRGR